jgi:metallo-beta-lactamase class B
MFRSAHASTTLSLILFAATSHAAAPRAIAPDAWDAPREPFRIIGDTWYVGTGGISVILVRGEHGAVLLDTSTASALPVVLANLEAIGVEPEQIKLILTSHAHQDHVGGLAEIKSLTGARVLATADSATLLAAGGRGDLHYGDALPYAPVLVDDTVLDGETVTLGTLAFTAHRTPGHTPGSTTWTWIERAEDQEIKIVYADSLAAPGYRLIDHPERPDLIAEFRQSIATIHALPCDVLLTPHPQASQLFERYVAHRRDYSETRGPVDPEACKRYADRAEAALDEQIAEQHRSKEP